MSTKFRTLKAMVFLVLMYGCESWTIKRLRAEELMFLNCGIGEDSWESPGLQRDQTSQSERKSTLNIHRKDWLMLKLSSYLTHLMRRANSLEKTPNAGRDRRQEEKGMTEDEMFGWHHWLKGHEFEQALGTVKDREAWHAAVAESDMTERLNSDNQESYSTGNKWAVHISHFLSTFVCSLTFPASSLMASIVQNAVLWSRA